MICLTVKAFLKLSVNKHLKIQGKSTVMVIKEILVWHFNPKVRVGLQIVGTDVSLVISRGFVCRTLFPPRYLSWYLLRLLGTPFPPVSLCQLSHRIPEVAPTLFQLQTWPGESNLPLLLRPHLAALCSLFKIQMIGAVVFVQQLNSYNTRLRSGRTWVWVLLLPRDIQIHLSLPRL